MSSRILINLIAALATTMVMTVAAGNSNDWRLIGSKDADRTGDHDTIQVKGSNDNFRKIKLHVSGADLNIKRLVVTYDNGEPDNIDVRENIRQGEETRALDLKGSGTRSIRKIDLWYDTEGVLKGKANVKVHGLK
jgi:hypothetical protein